MKFIYIIIVIVVFASCKDFEDDINKNPNEPSTATASQLIANSSIALQDVSHNLSGQFLAQYLSEVEYQDASFYPQESTSFYGWYQGPLMNLQEVLDNGYGSNNQQAMAKVLKAYFFWHITDRWGDVPYNEALNGIDNLTPIYDTQEAIYNSLFALLKEAEAQFDESSTLGDDIIYEGNVESWKKLANSIRLVMALRLSEVNPTLGKQEFVAAMNDGVMDSNGDSFIFQHLEDANNQSYWFSQIDPTLGNGREWWALSETLVEHMAPADDPRLLVYGRPNEDNDIVGLEFGTEGVINASEVSLLGTELWAQDAPVYLLTYSEILFDLAEAAKLGWISGSDSEAESYYNLAIEQSFLQWVGNTDELSDFMLEAEISYDAAIAVEQIATQRYVHLFMNGYEAWAEWRRTGYPDNMVAPKGNEVPTRQIYTENEQFNNSENYEAAIQRQFSGNETMYGHVWWDE